MYDFTEPPFFMALVDDDESRSDGIRCHPFVNLFFPRLPRCRHDALRFTGENRLRR